MHNMHLEYRMAKRYDDTVTMSNNNSSSSSDTSMLPPKSKKSSSSARYTHQPKGRKGQKKNIPPSSSASSGLDSGTDSGSSHEERVTSMKHRKRPRMKHKKHSPNPHINIIVTLVKTVSQKEIIFVTSSKTISVFL